MPLTYEQKQFIIANYPNSTNADLAKAANLKVGQITDFAKYNGLKKSPEHKTKMTTYAGRCQQKTPEEDKRRRKAEYHKIYTSSHHSDIRRNNKNCRDKKKRIALDHYSNGDIRCACCKIDRYMWMVIDHVNGRGLEHFRKIGVRGGNNFYRWLIKNNFPPGFQVLCYNCNFERGMGDKCECPFDFTQPNNLKIGATPSINAVQLPSAPAPVPPAPTESLPTECWQYSIKLASNEPVENIPFSDFDFMPLPPTRKREAINFIKKYEWLGTLPMRPSHWFITTHRPTERLAGVVIFSTPNKPSFLLGKDTVKLERLIARGSTAPWTPKNLGSKLIMSAINWMVANTQYRLFVGYSDPTAGEIGTIYQACNFVYLGGKNGASKLYNHPSNPNKWFNSRHFRRRSMWLKYARELGFDPEVDIIWSGHWTPNWNKTDPSVVSALLTSAKRFKLECTEKNISYKGKYVLVLGNTPKETSRLRKLLLEKVTPQQYPKRIATQF